MKLKQALVSSLFLIPTAAISSSNITFENIADDKETGISYERVKSKSFARMQEFRDLSLTTPQTFTDLFDMPHQSYGLPGVAIFDYDKDNDLDIYITNGPGAANSLYSNQLSETGELTFIDVATQSGVAATHQDSTAVCYGDIDNDNDHDLFVLGRNEANILYINEGNGQFTVKHDSNLGGGELSSVSCAMGDINNDGLLDITVGNGVNLDTYSACFVEVFSKNQPNGLYLNNGDNTFSDVSETSGIRKLGGLPEGKAGYTWAVSMIDINKDGAMDIVHADEQCGVPPAAAGGIDRGYIHVMINDGTGNFNDKPVIINDVSASAWMGLAFGDLNCDGNFDMLASNAGDYGFPAMADGYTLGAMSTKWFLGKGNGEFTDPGLGDLIASVFSWGVGIFDYDNDADQDMLWQGGLELDYLVWADNPGVLLENNNCEAKFTYKDEAIKTDYTRRNPRGMALGDLNKDGFTDFVTASNFTIPDNVELLLSPAQYGSVFDKTGYFVPLFDMVAPDQFVWNGTDLSPGTATIEINSANNDNGWVSVNVVGTKGITENGITNRDGIGAVLTFTPKSGKSVMTSVPSGSSFASQHSLESIFGLGDEDKGTLEILWPGNSKSKLYNVRNGETITVPEIPCSYDDAKWESKGEYISCVKNSLHEIASAGLIERKEMKRYIKSAAKAYKEHSKKSYSERDDDEDEDDDDDDD